ncbi:peroxiredoxin [uncultured Thalassospira sp.]|uniref:peroxiredoxin n=1 Tax=uncultured Thalassospira sp. TaxID=404382 RepID=UPI0030D8B951|tara:strand:+ start:232 stop:801 length:570 start_codon:yes stop_codon:yes gene_type:complete
MPQDKTITERDRLIGLAMPQIQLPATDGRVFDLGKARPDWLIVYCYPRTSSPNTPTPKDWDVIPGARGCTPQSCAFRDHYRDLQQKRADVVGLSTQSTDYQTEMVNRLHLPFPVLSDEKLELATALGLPVFQVDGMTLLCRLTLAIKDGIIRQVFVRLNSPKTTPMKFWHGWIIHESRLLCLRHVLNAT